MESHGIVLLDRRQALWHPHRSARFV